MGEQLPIVGRSWRRSEAYGVDRERGAPRYDLDAGGSERLMRAVQLVLEGAGTTALEARELTVVSGDEYDVKAFRWAAGVAGPIVHRMTRRLEGVPDFTCPRDVTTTSVSAERVDHASAGEGILVRLARSGDGAGAQRETGRAAAPDAGTDADPRSGFSSEVAAICEGRQPVLVIGEAGAGKLHAARQIHARGKEGAELVVVDAALALVDGMPAVLRDLSAALRRPGATVVLHHADALDPAGRRAAGALLGRMADDVRLIASVDPSFDDPEWTSRFPRRVTVPPLRERIDELPDIIRELIRRNGGTGRMQQPAIQALARHEWIGNVRELDGVIKAALERRRSSDLTLNDLPVQYRTPRVRRRLGRMEQVERAAIVRALAEADGNRTKAAAALEIGRATLYRKIRAYGLDVDARLM